MSLGESELFYRQECDSSPPTEDETSADEAQEKVVRDDKISIMEVVILGYLFLALIAYVLAVCFWIL